MRSSLLGLYTLSHEIGHAYNAVLTTSGSLNMRARLEAFDKGWKLKLETLSNWSERSADQRAREVLQQYKPNWQGF